MKKPIKKSRKFIDALEKSSISGETFDKRLPVGYEDKVLTKKQLKRLQTDIAIKKAKGRIKKDDK